MCSPEQRRPSRHAPGPRHAPHPRRPLVLERIVLVLIRATIGLMLVALGVPIPAAAQDWSGGFRCVDFEQMTPLWALTSSRTEALGSWDVTPTPIATDGAVIVYRPSKRSAVQCTRLVDHEPLWIFETGGDVNARPVIHDGVVYVGSDSGYLYAIDERTGELLWTFDARREATTTEKAMEAGGSLFGGLKSLTKAIEAGKSLAEKETLPNELWTSPAIAGDVLVLYVPRERFVGLNRLTGEMLWDTEFMEKSDSPISSWLPPEARRIPIDALVSDGRDVYFTLGGAVVRIDAATGAYGLPRTTEGVDEQAGGKVAPRWDIDVGGDRIVVSLHTDGLVAVGKRDDGELWRLDPLPIEGSYGDLAIDGSDGFVIVQGRGVVAFDATDGTARWTRTVENAHDVWIGQENVYVIASGKHVTALGRVNGAQVWERDFAYAHVSELLECRGALIFGKGVDGDNLVILSSEPRAVWAAITNTQAQQPDQPGAVVRKILGQGYPIYHIGTEQATWGLFTTEAGRELARFDFDGPHTRCDRWHLQLQEAEANSATVHVNARRIAETDEGRERVLTDPLWEDIPYRLVFDGGSWLIASPLPAPCRIGTQECIPLFDDTSGVERHPSGPTRTDWPVTMMPGDHWAFDVELTGQIGGAPTPTRGEGHIIVETPDPSVYGSEWKWMLRQTYWAPEPHALSEEYPRLAFLGTASFMTIRDGTLRLESTMHLGRRTFTLPLPLEDGYVAHSPEGYTTTVAVSEHPEHGRVAAVTITEEDSRRQLRFELSPRTGIVSWGFDEELGELKWRWSLSESRAW